MINQDEFIKKLDSNLVVLITTSGNDVTQYTDKTINEMRKFLGLIMLDSFADGSKAFSELLDKIK